MPRGDQLSRQWRLIQLIDRPQGIMVDDAACDLAVTIRTIWRDLDAPQKAGRLAALHRARRRRQPRRLAGEGGAAARPAGISRLKAEIRSSAFNEELMLRCLTSGS